MNLVVSHFQDLQSEKIPNLFAGEWCHLDSQKNGKTLEYHWKDRDKFRHDYQYLDNLVKEICLQLGKKLNELHHVNYDQKFWNLILYSWVSHFVSATYDKWETLNKAFNNFNIKKIKVYNFEIVDVPHDFEDYLKIYKDHDWNHYIFTQILAHLNQSNKNFKIEKIKNKNIKITRDHHKENIIINFLDLIASKIKKKNKIVFFNSYFTIINLFKLLISIKQIPRNFKEFNKKISLKIANHSERSNLKINLNDDEFQVFLSYFIFKNIPTAYVENFKNIISYSEKIAIDCDLILTSNANFPNEISKFWSAQKVDKGKKLILNEHGGSLPLKYRYYSIFNEIFDNRITWSKPTSSKEKQLTPSKLIGYEKIKKDGFYLSLIAIEKTPYAYYCRGGLQSSLVLDDFNQKEKFLNFIRKSNINFKIKPYKNMGWNLGEKYKKLFGEDHIVRKNLKTVISESKIIVCTYPATTFLEAIISGTPTILLFKDKICEIDDKFLTLKDELFDKKIAFSSAEEASDHIKKIWNNPLEWWSNVEIVKLRNQFLQECGKTNVNWLEEWKKYINNQISYKKDD